MRDFLLLALFAILITSCGGSVDSPAPTRDLVSDLQAYKEYMSQDRAGYSRDDEKIWELEWFLGLTDREQTVLLDSIGGFDHLRAYRADFGRVYGTSGVTEDGR